MTALALLHDAIDRGQTRARCLCPGPLVVKKGSKMRRLVSASMPSPVSVTLDRDVLAGSQILAGRAVPFTCTRRSVRIVNCPPRGMASRAFTPEIDDDLSIWPGSALMQAPVLARTDGIAICSPMMRWSSLCIS